MSATDYVQCSAIMHTPPTHLYIDNTVHEATYAVIEGQDVAIHSGSYDEHMILWRPMTLRKDGTGGVVYIGQ